MMLTGLAAARAETHAHVARVTGVSASTDGGGIRDSSFPLAGSQCSVGMTKQAVAQAKDCDTKLAEEQCQEPIIIWARDEAGVCTQLMMCGCFDDLPDGQQGRETGNREDTSGGGGTGPDYLQRTEEGLLGDFPGGSGGPSVLV